MIQILFQKQPFADFIQNWFSLKFCKTHRKTYVPESHFHFSYEFFNIFDRTSLKLLLSLSFDKPNYWVFLSFFLLIFLMFIDWSFSSLGFCFCPACQMITIKQRHFDSFTVCTLNKSPLGFLNQCGDIRGRKMGKIQWMFYPWLRENPN